MSIRSRPTITKQTSIPTNPPESPEPHQPPPPSLSQRTLTQTLTGTANLANLLPTGTLLALQLLTPTFTNGGACDSVTRPMTSALLSLLALFCFLASFTDSFRSPADGLVYYGFATFNGMWLFDSRAPRSDTEKYRVGLIDWVHGAAAVLVFAAVAMRDNNVVSCFYPTPSREKQEVLNLVPLAVGIVSSFLFMIFPSRRHGIGYPVTSTP